MSRKASFDSSGKAHQPEHAVQDPVRFYVVPTSPVNPFWDCEAGCEAHDPWLQPKGGDDWAAREEGSGESKSGLDHKLSGTVATNKCFTMTSFLGRPAVARWTAQTISRLPIALSSPWVLGKKNNHGPQTTLARLGTLIGTRRDRVRSHGSFVQEHWSSMTEVPWSKCFAEIGTMLVSSDWRRLSNSFIAPTRPVRHKDDWLG